MFDVINWTDDEALSLAAALEAYAVDAEAAAQEAYAEEEDANRVVEKRTCRRATCRVTGQCDRCRPHRGENARKGPRDDRHKDHRQK